MHLRTLLFAFAWLVLSTVAAPAADGLARVELEGEVFHPSPQARDGRTVWSLQDPEVQRLVSRTAARLQWSSSGQTLYVYSPVRETCWTTGLDTVRVDGEDQPARGRLQGREGDAFMEPEALLFALALAAKPGERTLVLRPLVGAVREVEQGGKRVVRVGVAVPVRWEKSHPAPGHLRLRFPGCAWEGDKETLAVGDLRVQPSGSGETILDLRFPPMWEGEAEAGLSLTEVRVQSVPQHSFPAKPVALQKAEFQRAGQGDAVALFTESPAQFFWSFDPGSRRLAVEFPGVQAGSLPEVRSPEASLLEGRFRTLGSADQPVLRFEGTLAPGASFTFFEMEQVPGSLVIRVGPDVPATADTGSAAMAGFAGGRGVIVLDAGHGGSDPGCVNRWSGVREKDVTLDVALRLRDLLEAQGWTVLMTREDDRDVSWAGSPDRVELQSRCDVANQGGADLFVSLHCNASASGAGSGTSIHWYKDEDYDLAQSLEFVLGGSLGLGQVGLRRDRFYVLRHTEMPAVLVEMAYLTHPEEGGMLARPDFRQQIAERLAGHLVAYMAGRFARAASPAVQRMP